MEVIITDKENIVTDPITQWDLGQQIIVKNIASQFDKTPDCHFYNKKSSEALLVSPTWSGNDLVCDIPNALTKEPYNIICHISLSESEDGTKQTTIYRMEIPVFVRTRPSEYVYEENTPTIYETKVAHDADMAVINAKLVNATLSHVGFVKPDGETTFVDSDGTIHAGNFETKTVNLVNLYDGFMLYSGSKFYENYIDFGNAYLGSAGLYVPLKHLKKGKTYTISAELASYAGYKVINAFTGVASVSGVAHNYTWTRKTTFVCPDYAYLILYGGNVKNVIIAEGLLSTLNYVPYEMDGETSAVDLYDNSIESRNLAYLYKDYIEWDEDFERYYITHNNEWGNVDAFRKYVLSFWVKGSISSISATVTDSDGVHEANVSNYESQTPSSSNEYHLVWAEVNTYNAGVLKVYDQNSNQVGMWNMLTAYRQDESITSGTIKPVIFPFVYPYKSNYELTKAIENVQPYDDTEIRGLINGKISSSEKGSSNGVAQLDSSGKVPSSQLPSYVDDVLEYNTKSAFPSTGESGKIYIDKSTNLSYRWSGTQYVEISPSLALGETEATAYRGDRGKTAYDHSQSAHARTDATKTEASTTNGNIKINGVETNVYTHPSGTNPHGTTASDVGLEDAVTYGTDTEVVSETPRDADTLGGRITASDVDTNTNAIATINNNLAQKAEIAKTTEKITTTVPAKGYDVYEISNQKNGYTPISCIPYGISLAIQCNISYYNNKFFVSLSNSYNYAINIDNNVEIYWIKNN